jgi:hypothetical protein
MKKSFIITNESVAKFNAYVAENKGSGKTMTQLFEEYAKAQGADISAEEAFEQLKTLPARDIAPEVLEQVAGGYGGGYDPDPGCCWGGCVTPDTLITLADGTEKRVDELQDDDRLMIWDFDRGCLSEAGITFFHRVKEEAPVLRVSFSDGIDVGVVMEHAFFDLTDRRFVAIHSASQAPELLGHRFAKLVGGKLTEVTLTGIMEDGTTDSYYSPVTEAHFNCFANGLLNISGFMAGLYNVFDLEENELKYDAAKKAAEIEAVGKIPYEVFASVASRELYDRNNAGWFSVSIAKGLTTAEALIRLFAFCRPFFVNGKNSTAA